MQRCSSTWCTSHMILQSFSAHLYLIRCLPSPKDEPANSFARATFFLLRLLPSSLRPLPSTTHLQLRG